MALKTYWRQLALVFSAQIWHLFLWNGDCSLKMHIFLGSDDHEWEVQTVWAWRFSKLKPWAQLKKDQLFSTNSNARPSPPSSPHWTYWPSSKPFCCERVTWHQWGVPPGVCLGCWKRQGKRELGPSWKPPRLAARPGDQVCCDLSQLRLRAHTSARSVWEVQDRHEDSEFVAYQKSSEKCRMWTCSRQNPSKKSVSKSGKVPMSGPPLVRNLPPVAGHITWSRHLYRPKWVMKTGKHGQFLCTFPLWIQ